MEVDVNALVQGLPSFAGLLFAITVLFRVIEGQRQQIAELQNAIIRRDNCPDE